MAVLVMHSDADYLSFSAGIELAERGYTVLCANPENQKPLFMKLTVVKDGVEYLRTMEGVERVVLLGHSGGATLMSAYQAVAESGGEIFRNENMVLKLSERVPSLPPADGVMLLDPNWGNGAVTLFSLDPAVIQEGNPRKLDPELDLFAPTNGFDPEGAHYSPAFLKKFLQAQGARMNRLIDFALERLRLIEAGKGLYNDDEPLLLCGADSNFMNNKLYAQDISLLSRTREAQLLLCGNGSRERQIIQTVRKPQNRRNLTPFYRDGLLVTTVRRFLDSNCVRTLEGYHYDAHTIYGVDWSGSYCCTTGNVANFQAPLLVMGMTAGWEFSSVEGIAQRAASPDLTVAYVEGATHMFCPEQGVTCYGNTLKTTYDFAAEWLGKSGRF
ncbi:MAG: alpha/beta hydrolase [Oscillospiraceae bacterium]|nr:alpha/beta hydrolase [Oscillospiraceae bacterium]